MDEKKSIFTLQGENGIVPVQHIFSRVCVKFSSDRFFHRGRAGTPQLIALQFGYFSVQERGLTWRMHETRVQLSVGVNFTLTEKSSFNVSKLFKA